MNLIIVGIGKVGETLVGNLLHENHDIVVVDKNYDIVDSVINRYDVKGIVGGGLERNVLLNAGADKADMVIACTSRDEMNILCCVLAKKIGARQAIARVRDPEIFKEMENMHADLGLDYAFNPELTTAHEIARVLKLPSARSVENFARSRARMAEFDVTENNPLVGKTLQQAAHEYGSKVLFGVVVRGEDAYIPHGDFVLKAGDRVYIIASESELVAFVKKLKIYKRRAKSVFIIGGGKIGYYLAQELLESGVGVKIVEKNDARAEGLSQLLPEATVLVGDGTDQEVLEEEDLKGADACVTLTGMDEENVMISLYARENGVGKIVTKIDRPSILKMVKHLGLDTVVSPRNEIANHIVRYVRAYQTSTGEGADALYKIGDKAEALEFTVGANFQGKDTPLKDLSLKNNVLIGGVVRQAEFVLPSGETILKEGDRVIVLTANCRINNLSQILAL